MTTRMLRRAVREIKQSAPDEPGRYRVGPYVLIVSANKMVIIETVE